MTEKACHVLVVDDNEVDRLKLTRILEGEGHTVSGAGEGHEALAMLRAQPFELVLLDIAMPEMDGYAVLESMQAERGLRDIPVLMISAVEGTEAEAKCRNLGARGYVSKSSSAEVLKARVADCLGT